MSRTIVLVHGAWLNGDSWGAWKKRYEEKGYTVLAPSWPHDERPPAELNASPHPELGKVGPQAIVDSYDKIITGLAEKPIIIGHSVGGVYTQMLANRGRGVACVVIDPAPTPGVGPGPHFIVSATPVFTSPSSLGGVLRMSRKHFGTRFAQTLPENLKDEHYKWIVPTPGKVYWDGLLGIGPKVEFGNPNRPPMLMIVGEKDLIADASMARAIYNKQKKAPSLTEFKEYKGKSHWLCMEPGWEEIADFALDWAVRNAKA
jgi:pimeloyl-ACP methyl ester carboxylesterase